MYQWQQHLQHTLPTSKRDVADDIAEGSASKQQRTATRETAPARPETTIEPPATRTRITAVTVNSREDPAGTMGQEHSRIEQRTFN